MWGECRGIARGLRGYCTDTDKSCNFVARLAIPASAALFILSSDYCYYFWVGGNFNLSEAVPVHNSVCSDVFPN